MDAARRGGPVEAPLLRTPPLPPPTHPPSVNPPAHPCTSLCVLPRARGGAAGTTVRALRPTRR